MNHWPIWAQSKPFWLPAPESTTAPVMDRVFYLILAICSFFFLVIVGLMVLFVIRYRRRPGVEPGRTATHHNTLEIVWTVIPLLIVGLIFYKGFAAYMDMQTAPPGCYEIRVSARQWAWQFIYPNGHVDENLHVPVDEPVRLIMTSEDVIHGIAIPAFRVKMDLVPGMYTSTWFRAVRPGTYDLYCTEFCGDDHSDMLALVVVHGPGDFEKWLKDAANFLKTLPPAEAGEMLYRRRGCSQCHSTDGTAGTGPSFLGIYGKTHSMAGGESVVVDDNYIRESILEPQKKIRAGYQPVMATYQGIVSDDDITALIEFIKKLNQDNPTP
ncbi:MAG: cytochrome c oxidase subunit II [Pirellulales bacterium]|nr:cytochrome c oxidase subunit II [Pirellulales bacterium]